jgi:zinc transport system ATP-binding protein
MMTPLVTLRDVSVRFDGRTVLDGVCAELPRGRVTALIGPNGSGKTTLLRTLLNEVPFAGRIAFHCGHNHAVGLPRGIGYVPQRLLVDARLPLTVKDLLGLALQRRPLFLGIGRRTLERMREVLRRVELPVSLLDALVEKLSGGELQRVLLGLALEPPPELLLLDEPAASLDAPSREKVAALIAAENKRTGVTVALVSHDLGPLGRQADHVLCLRDGRILNSGPPAEVMTPQTLAATFAGAVT